MFGAHIGRRVGIRIVITSTIAVVVVSTLLLSWMFRASTESRPAIALPMPPQLIYAQTTPPGAEIVSVATDGTSRQIVASVAQPENADFRLDRLDDVLLSPDGQWLAFNRYECTRGENVECRAWAWVMSLDGAEMQKIKGDHDYYEVVQWFPDSRHLLIRDRPLTLALVFDVQTGEFRQLDIPERRYSISRGSLSPDGSRLVYSAYTGEWVYNLDGSGRIKLDLPQSGSNLFHMSWSPQGDQVAVVTVDVGREELYNSLSAGELWVVYADGTNPRQLSAPDTLVFAPLWSPAGTEIYFVQTEPGTFSLWQNQPDRATGNLWAVQVETGALRALTSFRGKKVQSPDLSPDGSTIAFITNAGGSQEIWTIRVDGSHLRQITNDGRLKVSVAWLPQAGK